MGAGAPAESDADVEILRAALLVSRARTDELERLVRSAGDEIASDVGLRCVVSGPWAPYSFAGAGEEAA